METKVNTQDKVIADSCDWTSVVKSNNKQRTGQQVALLQAVSKERNDVIEKASNVVIFGLPEIVESDSVKKRQMELDSVKKVFDSIKVAESSIANVRSLRPSNGTAPLVVKLRSVESKNTVLSKSKNLKNSVYNKVFINPDLTDVQRKVFKALLEERKKLNSERSVPEQKQFYFGIRNERVVRISIKENIRGGGTTAASNDAIEDGSSNFANI